MQSNLARITFCSEKQMLPITLQTFIHLEENPLFCLFPECDKYLEELGYKYSRIIEDSEPKAQTNNVIKNNYNYKNFNNNLNNTNENAFNMNNFNNNNNNNTNSLFDTLKRYEVTNRDREIYRNLAELPPEMKCFKCKRPGHLANNCPNSNNLSNNNNNYNNANFNNNRNNNNFNKNNGNSNNVMNSQFHKNNFNKNNDNSIKCYKCGQIGHYASTCLGNNLNQRANQNFNPNNSDNNNNFNSFNQNNNFTNNSNNNNLSAIKCYKCNQMGHYANKCPNNNNNNNKNFKNFNNSDDNLGFDINNLENTRPSKRNYQTIKQKNPCKVCGVLRHSKDSNCIAMKKNKKFKDFSQDFE